MEDWLRAGSRIKADWAAMLEGLVSRSREPVKIPFVPLRISGRALRAVLEDMLPVILGPNPSLLTVILEDGRAIKAYAEDASHGVYEKLVRLPADPDPERPASREELIDLARSAGVEPGVVKEAETRFFEPFAEESEDLIDALALLAASGAEALHRGWIRFDPPLAAAELAGRLRLGRESLTWIISRLLPEGRYGIGLACTAGSGGLVLEVSETDGATWTVREVEADSSTVSGLARELIERHGCGLAAAVRLPALARLMGDELSIADFLQGPGEHWAIETRSGLEGLLAALPRLASLLGLERDLEECDISFDSILGLVGDYLRHAAAHAAKSGVAVKLKDSDESVTILWDAEGVKEGKSQAAEGDADEADEPLELDLALVRRAISVLSSDPLAGLREAVPLEVMDEVSYATAVALVECRRPKGRLLLFGGPHRFFNRAWEGDSCAVFVEKNGRLHVVEQPSRPLVIEDEGRRIAFESDEVRAELHLERARTRRDLHGVGRLVGAGQLAEWLPGLDVTRGLHRVVSCRGEFDGRELSAEGGWVYLEEGRGKLLRWPFGATWHYASWLFPPGDCGSGVHVAPMLGRSTPQWWRRLLEISTDGAALLTADDLPDRQTGDDLSRFETALSPGPPVRLVRDAARAGDTLLQYGVLSAALVPFDEDGQMIFRLRCLVTGGRPTSAQAEPIVGEGVGLVEIPATLPGVPPEACACDVVFTETGASFRTQGRELLALESGGSRFLGPYVAAPPAREGGILRRMARRASAIFERE